MLSCCLLLWLTLKCVLVVVVYIFIMYEDTRTGLSNLTLMDSWVASRLYYYKHLVGTLWFVYPSGCVGDSAFPVEFP